jgi:hypothetical protein
MVLGWHITVLLVSYSECRGGRVNQQNVWFLVGEGNHRPTLVIL